MTRNYSLDPAHRDERRRRVEYLKIRGLSNREVVKALAKAGFNNPATGEPYGNDTVDRDVRWIRGRWQERHEGEMAEHRAFQLATIREGLRVAWAREDLAEIRLYLKREAELLGLDAPKEQRFAGPRGGPVQLQVEPTSQRSPTEAQQIREIDRQLRELEAELEAELEGTSPEEEGGDTTDRRL